MIGSNIYSQTMQWGSLRYQDKHIIHTGFGFNYGLNFEVGYGYQLPVKKIPMVIGANISIPFGEKLGDDFKTDVGISIRWYTIKNFHFSTNIRGIFRRMENTAVTILDFGSNTSAVIGYYRKRWFVSAEVGFDKAIINHFHHSDYYRQVFPGVKDGWYEPSAGGNFYTGFQTGATFGIHDIYLKGGYIWQQNFKDSPVLPFYLEVGYQIRLGKKTDVTTEKKGK